MQIHKGEPAAARRRVLQDVTNVRSEPALEQPVVTDSDAQLDNDENTDLPPATAANQTSRRVSEHKNESSQCHPDFVSSPVERLYIVKPILIEQRHIMYERLLVIEVTELQLMIR